MQVADRADLLGRREFSEIEAIRKEGTSEFGTSVSCCCTAATLYAGTVSLSHHHHAARITSDAVAYYK